MSNVDLLAIMTDERIRRHAKFPPIKTARPFVPTVRQKKDRGVTIAKVKVAFQHPPFVLDDGSLPAVGEPDKTISVGSELSGNMKYATARPLGSAT